MGQVADEEDNIFLEETTTEHSMNTTSTNILEDTTLPVNDFHERTTILIEQETSTNPTYLQNMLSHIHKSESTDNM